MDAAEYGPARASLVQDWVPACVGERPLGNVWFVVVAEQSAIGRRGAIAERHKPGGSRCCGEAFSSPLPLAGEGLESHARNAVMPGGLSGE